MQIIGKVENKLSAFGIGGSGWVCRNDRSGSNIHDQELASVEVGKQQHPLPALVVGAFDPIDTVRDNSLPIAALKAAHAEQTRVAALSHELWESARPVNKRLTTAVAVGLLKTFDGLSPMAVAQIVGKSKKSSAFVMTKAEFQCACKLAVEAGGKLPPSLAGRTDVPNVRSSVV